MNESKLGERFATPSSSKLAQILLDLRGVEGQGGICNLQQSDIHLWSESYRQEQNEPVVENNLSSEQDTCNCRKSKCLKLYCQCFAARATCSSSCRCVSCENRPDNISTRDAAVNLILERNPNAFDSKYRPTAPSLTAVSNTFTAITGIAHKNGCRCRKSLCLKKYCECFQGGVPCSSICTCLSCQNTGPAMSQAAGTSTSSTASALPLERATSGLLATNSTDSLHLSNMGHYSMFDNGVELSEQRGSAYGPISDKTGSAGSESLIASSSSSSKPPLVPGNNKRKREGSGGGDDELDAAVVVETPSRSNTMSRAESQALLKELLIQELTSQGILSSPLTSFLSNNGLMQSQVTTMDDINRLFQGGTSVATPAAASAESSAAAAQPTPNTMSIATALALWAANAQAQQALAVSQQKPLQSAPSSEGSELCDEKIVNFMSYPSDRSTVPSSASACEAVRRLQQEAASLHDPIDALSSSGAHSGSSASLNNHAYTPVAAAPALLGKYHTSSLSSQGLTDDETIGTGGSSHSHSLLSTGPDKDRLMQVGLDYPLLHGAAKELFRGLPSPDAVQAPLSRLLPLGKAGSRTGFGSGFGVTRGDTAEGFFEDSDGFHSAAGCDRKEKEKENAPPNTAPSFETLWR